MKIAILVRAYLVMPRPSDMIYAPVDLAIDIAKGLGAKGHDVTVFGPIGTEVHAPNVRVETLNLRPLVTNQEQFNDMLDNTEQLAHYVPALWDAYMIDDIYRRAALGEFDLVHIHHPETALATSRLFPDVPTAFTLHDPVYPWYRELFELYAEPNHHYISISDNQRRDAPDLPYAATVYNGTNVELFSFSEEHEDYLLFAGRITPQKGVKEAIQVAKETNHRLLIIGPVAHGSEGYFEQYIKPELNERILYLGRVDQNQLPTYYQKAKALLTPVQWEEPFGLTTVEAMACGAPVISLNRGAAPEIIADGRTGYIVNSIAEMIEAVGKVERIRRRDCRDHVQRHFATERMVDSYERAFLDIIQPGGPHRLRAKYGAEFIKDKLRKVRERLPRMPK